MDLPGRQAGDKDRRAAHKDRFDIETVFEEQSEILCHPEGQRAGGRGIAENDLARNGCIGDGRQSGTSGSPSILNASPEAATGGGLAILKTGDRIRIDLNKRTANVLISKAEYASRMRALAKRGGFKIPDSQTPWQEIQRGLVDELSRGMVLKPAVKYQRISTTKGTPRDNH